MSSSSKSGRGAGGRGGGRVRRGRGGRGVLSRGQGRGGRAPSRANNGAIASTLPLQGEASASQSRLAADDSQKTTKAAAKAVRHLPNNGNTGTQRKPAAGGGPKDNRPSVLIKPPAQQSKRNEKKKAASSGSLPAATAGGGSNKSRSRENPAKKLQQSLKILCLHGNQQTSEIFKSRLSRLLHRTKDFARYVFVDGVEELPLQPGQQAPVKCWWHTSANGNIPSRAAASKAASAISTVWRDQGPFDGIIGFSQGAACTFLLLLMQQQGLIELPGLRFVVVAGGYLPDIEERHTGNDSQATLSCVKSLHCSQTSSLHLYGTKDRAVPPRRSKAAADRFALPNPPAVTVVHEHSGAHEFPQRAQDLQVLTSFLQRSADTSAAPVSPQTINETTGLSESHSLAADNSHHGSQRLDRQDAGQSIPKAQANSPLAPDFSRLPPLNDSDHSLGVALEQPEDVQEELESLEACFPDEFTLLSGPNRNLLAEFRVQFTFSEDLVPSDADVLALCIRLPRGYPANSQPLYEFQTRPRVGGASSSTAAATTTTTTPWQFAVQQNQYSDYSVACLLAAEKAMSNVLTENAGECVVLQLHAAAQDSIEQHLSSTTGGPTKACDVVPAKSSTAELTTSAPTDAAAATVADATNSKRHDATKWWDEELVFEDLAPESVDWSEADHATESGAAAGAMHEHAKMVLDAVEKAAAAQARELSSSRNRAPVHYASSQRGAWDFVVGLVGKPSAGKSTFFNAASRPRSEHLEAKMGAFPFTTIASNVGRAMFSAPDPAAYVIREDLDPTPKSCLLTAESKATGGQVPHADGQNLSLGLGRRLNERYHSMTMKDVAGLVPGAYCGRGRGNAFLNELCDADVLIHIVDAAGLCDENGNGLEAAHASRASGGEERSIPPVGDPLKDISWVYQEIHMWIFENVRRKWHGVRKRPKRLPELFTGYRATTPMVVDALARMGLRTDGQSRSSGLSGTSASSTAGATTTQSLLDIAKHNKVHWADTLRDWEARDLHELVAHFIRIRFPIVVALNKIDLAKAAPGQFSETTVSEERRKYLAECAVADNVRRIRAALPHETVACVSASLEWTLVKLHRSAGTTSESDRTLPAASPEVTQRLKQELRIVRPFCRGSGVLDCVNRAVHCKLPVLVYPVVDIDTLEALDGTGRLAMCITMKWGSTVEDLWKHLARQPKLPHLRGDFVRAAARGFYCNLGVAPNPSKLRGEELQVHGTPFIGRKTNAKKTDVLSDSNCIIQVMVRLAQVRGMLAGWLARSLGDQLDDSLLVCGQLSSGIIFD